MEFDAMRDYLLACGDELPPDQAWFWTEEWQAGEREADEDIREGRFEVVEDIDAFFESLHNDSGEDAP